MTVSPIPPGFSAVTPYLIVKNAHAAIEFYKAAFGAIETRRMQADDKIMHADLKIGNAHFMMADEFPGQGFQSPQSLGGSHAFIHLYVENADASFKRAIDAGATELRPVSDQFFGDRHGLIQDPFGYTWTIAPHIEDVSNDEVNKRLLEYTNQ